MNEDYSNKNNSEEEIKKKIEELYGDHMNEIFVRPVVREMIMMFNLSMVLSMVKSQIRENDKDPDEFFETMMEQYKDTLRQDHDAAVAYRNIMSQDINNEENNEFLDFLRQIEPDEKHTKQILEETVQQFEDIMRKTWKNC